MDNKELKEKKTEYPFECVCGFTSKITFDEPKSPAEAGPYVLKEFQKHNEECPVLKQLTNQP